MKQVIHETPVLTQPYSWADWHTVDLKCWLCDSALQDLWHIPPAIHISLEVSTRPLLGAWRIRVQRWMNSAHYYKPGIGHGYLMLDCGKWLRKNLLPDDKPRWLYVRLILHENA